MSKSTKSAFGVRLPPGCGKDLEVPVLENPYIHGPQGFDAARRLRFCLNCKTVGSSDINMRLKCGKCGMEHTNNLTAPRVFDRFLLLAGRGGGKTLAGAHAARSEMLVPNSIGWVMGATYKILHDSTFPTLIGLIPSQWVTSWDQEHMELRLTNGALVAFRSLDDPERARGPHGVSWGWIDEAAQAPERAYDVFVPTLIKAAGILIATTTPFGFDWTYDRLEKQSLVYKEPGYWSASWWTEENPLFKSNPIMMAQIERKKKTTDPDFYAQEYRAERRNATGLVYGYHIIDKQILRDDDTLRKFIPEWPAIDPRRQILVGLDSGADHPFGAVKGVVTEQGIVLVAEYLERMQAISQQLPRITTSFGLVPGMQDIRWSSNKNEANLRLEFGLRGVGVIPAEAKHEIGIQRVQSWLYAGQLYFAYTVPKTIQQMTAYRYKDNKTIDGQKKKEEVFKFADELPDCIRYMLMAWPSLPKEELKPAEKGRDIYALDEQTRGEILRMKKIMKSEEGKDRDLEPAEGHYPMGDQFYQQTDGDDGEGLYVG